MIVPIFIDKSSISKNEVKVVPGPHMIPNETAGPERA